MDNSPASKALRRAAKQGSEAGVLQAVADGAAVDSKDRAWINRNHDPTTNAHQNADGPRCTWRAEGTIWKW